VIRIGELARQADVQVETIRFYERRGLLPKPRRTVGGYREYPTETLDRLGFILRAKQLGFSLKEIDELLSLKPIGAGAADVRAQASDKIRDIDDKILDLQRMRSRLFELLQSCSGSGSTEDCPILAALAAKG
jgi:Hg(II)-responsive transcriptional regulator